MTDAQKIRQLEHQLAAWPDEPAPHVTRKIDLLNELAWALSDIDLKRAQALSETARALADGDAPYPAGLAYSLRTLGYLNLRLGDYPLSLTQLLQSQEFFESLKLFEGLPDVLDGIASIYFHTGNYPEALNQIYRQLAAAQRLGDQRLIANAYNNLANIYFETGDYRRAIDTLHHNLAIAAKINYPRIEALAYLNLSETHLLAGNYQQALENAQRALQVSQAAGFELFEVYAFDFIGKASLKLGEAQAAIDHLDRALALSRKIGSKVTEALILLNIGQAHRDRQQPDLALASLQQSLTIAQAINGISELVKGHLLLSELYEQQGDLAQALHHFKQHHAFKELLLGEKADQRLKVLQVAHDVVAARTEAELLQLKTEELSQTNDSLEQQVASRTAELNDTIALLKQEINEREQAQAETQHLLATLEQRVAARTQELSTFFDLTVLASRAANLANVFQQAMPRILEVTRSRVICLHLFEPERATLSLAVHQNLPDEAQTRLRRVDLSPALRRWLQQPGDPLVTTSLASLTILPPPFHLPQFQTYLGAQIRIGRRVEGILSCYRFTRRGFGLDEISLVAALAEQLGIVLETHRLRRVTAEMAVLEERQRLARDLHDSVTQSLYSLSLLSRAGREAAADGDQSRLIHSLTQLERNTLHTLREMRLLLYELRPADLEQEGLTRAITLRLNTVEQRVGLRLDVHLDELPELAPNYEIELYHIIMEAMNNVIKHAAASHLTLHLTRAHHHLRLLIADNGQGFDPAQTSGGLGLRNIRERVTRLNGQLTIESQPGGGVRLEAEIPCPVEEKQ